MPGMPDEIGAFGALKLGSAAGLTPLILVTTSLRPGFTLECAHFLGLLLSHLVVSAVPVPADGPAYGLPAHQEE